MAIGWSKHLPLLPLIFLVVLFSSSSLLHGQEYSLDNAKVISSAEESITATTKLSAGRGGGGGSRSGGGSRGGGGGSRSRSPTRSTWHGGAYGYGGAYGHGGGSSEKEHKKNAAGSSCHLPIMTVLIAVALGTVILQT